MRSETDINNAIDIHANLIRRICFLHIRNEQDTEDIFQDVFIKYAVSDIEFPTAKQERAWLIKVAINACKDLQKSFAKRNVSSIEEILHEFPTFDETDNSTMEAILKLHEKYREVIYLFYYEGYSAIEISRILGEKENTVYTRLARGRKQLKETLGGDYIE
jgi:RNA polymerase sigma-70 factor (ECF subfamily)